jgi:hypothetical protein
VGDEVYEAETSPVSTRFARPPVSAIAFDDDDHDGETGAISEGDVHAFARKSFGAIASPYHHMFTNVAFSIQSTDCVK